MLDDMMPFLTALIVGLLIGIERERSKAQEDDSTIWGARTFPLLALTGVIIAFLGDGTLTVLIGLFIGILILAGHIYWDKSDTTWHVGATTAIAAILTFLLGFLSHTHDHIAMILAVILFGFLALKTRLHEFAQTGITKEEMRATLTVLISAVVILPLLPNEFIDPWNLIHPTKIWFLFVVIAIVEFSSYIALKQLGIKWGVLLTGLLGGFASATATTFSLALKSKEQLSNVLLITTSGIILAEVSSLVIQIIVLKMIAPDAAGDLILFLATPALIGLLCALGILVLRKNTGAPQKMEVELKNPISIKSTAKFAFLISAGIVLIAIATRLFGEAGAYVTSALGGAVSLRVVTFSVSELTNSGELLVKTASISILVAMTVNMLMKLGIIYKASGIRLAVLCAGFFSIMLGGGILVYFLNIDLFLETYFSKLNP